MLLCHRGIFPSFIVRIIIVIVSSSVFYIEWIYFADTFIFDDKRSIQVKKSPYEYSSLVTVLRMYNYVNLDFANLFAN